jgi:hypothetical protein
MLLFFFSFNFQLPIALHRQLIEENSVNGSTNNNMAAFTTMLEKRMTLALWLVIALVGSIVMSPASCESQDGELFNNNNVNNIKNNKQYHSEGKYFNIFFCVSLQT